MASPQEVQTPSSATIDPQQYQQFQTHDGPSTFNPMISASHTADPASLTLPPVTHPHAMPSIFPPEIEHGHAIPIAMQMPLSAMSSHPADLSTMDVVSATPMDSAVSHTLVPDFSHQNGPFSVDRGLNGLEALDASHTLASSPSATTASTNASHASSPAMSGMASSFSVGSSSLASALDGMAATRSRSGSSASPPNLTSSSSDLGFSSGGSGPPTSAHEPGLQYPLAGYDNTQPTKENSPEQPGSAHLLVLGDMLKNIARTANSGRQACDMGSTSDAQQIVETLRKNVMLVADLVAAMQLADGAVMSSPQSSPHSHSTGGTNPSALAASAVPGLDVQQHINGLSSFPQCSSSVDSNAMLDPSEQSRKRTASSAAGIRAAKTMKLEPQDESLNQIQPPAAMHMSAPGFPFAPSIPSMQSSMSSMPDMSTISASMSLPSAANSRPPSSAGMPPLHTLNMTTETQSATHSMQSALQFPPLDLSHPPVHSAPEYPTSAPATMTSNTMTSNTLPSTSFNPSMPNNIWTDPSIPMTRHHAHSLSSSSVLVGIPETGMNMNMPGPSTIQYAPPPHPPPSYNSPTRVAHLHQPPVPVSSVPPPAVHQPALQSVRSSRSSSFAHPQGEVRPILNTFDHMQPRPSTSHSARAYSPEQDYDDDMDTGHDSDNDENGDFSQTPYNSASPAGSGDGTEVKPGGEATVQPSLARRRTSRSSPAAEGGSTTASHGNEVPQEYRAEVERIFFEFLNNTCSNLDATDAKGEPIHQTLMAKKMQRLDESPDFRPFKFRIQAFTNAFLEELARQGYPEEKIPMKKIRNFLWNQPYISRFNEDGKKSKSKGNHIWHVDAKKSDGGWVFRPFKRRLAGSPPGVAYVGLRWHWTPRVWDPQASRNNMPVKYSSPSLPLWLSWEGDTLAGSPTPDSQSCDVTVEARFMQDGKEELLTHTVHITIAPMASVDSTFAPSRRPSLVNELNPRRVLSDSVVAQTVQPRLMRAQTALAPAPPPVVAPDSQVVQVLTTAAQRVAQEAQSQVVASPNDVGPELQALAKQQHVLTVTAQAFNSRVNGESCEGPGSQSNALAAAAQQVVLQAARQVAADRTVAAVSSGLPPTQSVASQVTVKDVSVATQSAVAQAVDMVGPLSSEVDVLMTASSLLQQQTRTPLPPGPIVDAQLVAADPIRPHTTGATSVQQYGLSIAVLPSANLAYFPS